MMNIEKTWFYAALAASLGGGFGAGVAVSPSKSDMEQARAYNNSRPCICEETDDDREFRRTKPQNTPGKDF